MQYFDYIIAHYGWQGTSLAAAAIVLFCVQMYYYLGVYRRVSSFRNSRRKKILTSEPPLSVVVPIFSEDYSYLDRLPQLLAQQYGSTFEVVLVYVGRDTDFYEELTRQRLLYPNLSVTKIEFNPRFPISVKMALNVGIKSARNEHIVITTTSAIPSSEQWLAMMGKGFMRGNIVLGYTAIEPADGLANYIMRMSRLQCSLYWLAAAVNKQTFKGSRHNFGFTKSIYFGAKGFTHLNMNIGENDLFIQRISTLDNVSVVLIPKGTMVERQWGGLKWWLSHLHHYAEAYRFYPIGARNAMEWDVGSQMLFFLTTVTALVFMPLEFKAVAALLLLIRYAVVVARVSSVAKRVGERGVVLRYFLFDLINPLMVICLRLAMMRKDSTAWK